MGFLGKLFGVLKSKKTLAKLEIELLQTIKKAYDWGGKNDWPAMEKYPQYKRVRAIGTQLYAMGGYEDMRAAHDYVFELRPVCGGMIQQMWNGIGGWMA